MSIAETHPGLSLSGGIHDLETAKREVRELIEKERDVKACLELAERVDGKFLYLIETPFETWPKFVVGLTSRDNSEVEILHKCGLEINGRAAWQSFRLSGAVPSPAFITEPVPVD
jgi:hypothetical protein